MRGMWRELINALPGPPAMGPPVSANAIAEAERVLGQSIPADLAALLAECDGVGDEYSLYVVWPAERIAAENRLLREDEDLGTLYMSFDQLLFFGDAGNGDLFALVPHTGRPDVFAWDHETDSRTRVAAGLDKYLDGWLTGKISL